MSGEKIQTQLKEPELLKKQNNKRIIKFYEMNECSTRFYLEQELMSGGDQQEQMILRKSNKKIFCEDEIKVIINP